MDWGWLGGRRSRSAMRCTRCRHAPPSSRGLEFGFDLENLYVKVAGSIADARGYSPADQQLSFNFLKPEGCRIVISADAAGFARTSSNARPRRTRDAAKLPGHPGRGRTACLELQVPFQCLGVTKDSTVAFIVAIKRRRC